MAKKVAPLSFMGLDFYGPKNSVAQGDVSYKIPTIIEQKFVVLSLVGCCCRKRTLGNFLEKFKAFFVDLGPTVQIYFANTTSCAYVDQIESSLIFRS